MTSPIKGYLYQPHRSLPEALADFLDAQERPISGACSLDIAPLEEGISAEWQWNSIRYFVQEICHSTIERMRRARVEYSDGFGMNIYLAREGEDSWCVRYIDPYIIVKLHPVGEDEKTV